MKNKSNTKLQKKEGKQTKNKNALLPSKQRIRERLFHALWYEECSCFELCLKVVESGYYYC